MCFLQKFAANFVLFSFFVAKMQKMTISTSVWSAQHPTAGQNIQHVKHWCRIRFDIYPIKGAFLSLNESVINEQLKKHITFFKASLVNIKICVRHWSRFESDIYPTKGLSQTWINQFLMNYQSVHITCLNSGPRVCNSYSNANLDFLGS